MDYFRQCNLMREEGDLKSYLTSWIPEVYAQEGHFLELKNRDTGEWVNGWKVVRVGTDRRTSFEVVQRSQDWKKQRKASDI